MPDLAPQVALAPRRGREVAGARQVLQLSLAPQLDLVVSVDQASLLVPSVALVVGAVPSDPVPDFQGALAPQDSAPHSLAAR